MQVRRLDTNLWLAGYTEKIGSAEVLFRALERIEPESRIEMVFRMPVSDPCDLVCSGTVLRVELSPTPDVLPLISATIDRYSFVRL
jgi:hypothetical protein